MSATVELETIAAAGAIALLAPHPDDETLGCGGLIARAVDEGRRLVVVSVTSGGRSHPGSRAFTPGGMAHRRSRELEAALAALGLDRDAILRLELDDGAVAAADLARTGRAVAERLRARGVTTVLTTGPDDAHPDHRATFEIARLAAAALDARLWSYPVRAPACAALAMAGHGPGAAHVRLDVSAALARKRAAIACHTSQLEGGVPDDPAGFHLTVDDLDWHLRPYEAFVRRSVSSR